jgi:hypothetical protein
LYKRERERERERGERGREREREGEREIGRVEREKRDRRVRDEPY